MAALTFEAADAVRFPGLHLSWQALKAPEGTTTVLNAANEVAVAAFLAERLPFDRIQAVNQATWRSWCHTSAPPASPRCWIWMPRPAPLRRKSPSAGLYRAVHSGVCLGP